MSETYLFQYNVAFKNSKVNNNLDISLMKKIFLQSDTSEYKQSVDIQFRF